MIAFWKFKNLIGSLILTIWQINIESNFRTDLRLASLHILLHRVVTHTMAPLQIERVLSNGPTCIFYTQRHVCVCVRVCVRSFAHSHIHLQSNDPSTYRLHKRSCKCSHGCVHIHEIYSHTHMCTQSIKIHPHTSICSAVYIHTHPGRAK